WQPRAVAVIEMPDIRIVEIDRALHEPQAEHRCVELDIARRVRRERGDVGNAAERLAGPGHGRPPSVATNRCGLLRPRMNAASPAPKAANFIASYITL